MENHCCILLLTPPFGINNRFIAHVNKSLHLLTIHFVPALALRHLYFEPDGQVGLTFHDRVSTRFDRSGPF